MRLAEVFFHVCFLAKIKVTVSGCQFSSLFQRQTGCGRDHQPYTQQIENVCARVAGRRKGYSRIYRIMFSLAVPVLQLVQFKFRTGQREASVGLVSTT